MAKNKRPMFTTPRGTASYAYITQPDTAFNQSNWKCTLLIDPEADLGESKGIPHAEEVAKFVKSYRSFEAKVQEEQLEELQEKLNDTPKGKRDAIEKLEDLIEKCKKRFKSPLKEVYDDETGEPTGTYSFFVKSATEFDEYQNGKKTGKRLPLTPKLYDSRGYEIKGERPAVFAGSLLRFKSTANPYSGPTTGVGVSAKMSSVQIIELSQGGGSGGFDAEDGGFVAEDDAPTVTAPQPSYQDAADSDY